jgi:hypothetical protein
MDIEAKRNEIKEEFRYYLSKVARSSRATDGSFYLSPNAVNSYLSFLEVDKLFDYAPQKWTKIKSIYDITDIEEIEKVAKKLLSDPDFIDLNRGKNNGWRSGSIMHYVCFINARNYFSKEKDRIENLSNACLPLNQGDISPRQIIYYGAPGTGKSHTIEKEEDAGLTTCIRTTFHPDSDYSTFVGCYKPHKCRETETLTYEFVPQAFLEAYTQAWQNPQKEIALVIEEINRGNCAQIFGDIFQLLDRDKDGWSTYPIKSDTDIAEYLDQMEIAGYSETMVKKYGESKAGYGYMALPPNMSLLATMNTSDQSLFPIDSAFKRRWDWKYVKIKNGKDKLGNQLNWKIVIKDEADNVVKVGENEEISWWTFIENINTIIASMTSSADKQLGYFFCKPTEKAEETDEEPSIITADTLVGKVIFYLWNDVFKDYGFEDAYLFSYLEKVEGKDVEKDLTFADFYDEDGEHVNTRRLADFLGKVLTWQKNNEGKE